MQKTQLNPWGWQDQYGYSQGFRVDGGQAMVFVAGQIALDADGALVGPGDFAAQCRQVFTNIATVLAKGGATFENVMKVTVYLPDMSHLADYARIKGEFIDGLQPASTAIEVKGLAFPGLMIEVEAIAVL